MQSEPHLALSVGGNDGSVRNSFVDEVLRKLAELIQNNQYEDLESQVLEIKPVPPARGEWKELHKSVDAFLNTRGGVVILGVKDETTGEGRRYTLTGWHEHAEPNLARLPRLFSDRGGGELNLQECFPPMELRPLLNERVAIVYVDELPSDRKFVFYEGEAYRRVLTGDCRIPESEIDAQEELKIEAENARELQIMPLLTIENLDLDLLNDYIANLNRPFKVETIKADLGAARPFLERKRFLTDGHPTLLGYLVCGKHPMDHLGFRCQVHGYVDMPQGIARDKQDFAGNILPLMESSLGYVLRNILVGVSPSQGGQDVPQYPEPLLRETVNNALAHRDYSIDKHSIIAIKPGVHVSIQNPGSFRRHLLIEEPDGPIPLRRIKPEARPRNPRLADVLRVYRKWEGRGIGMSMLVSLSLENKINLPYYRLTNDEVCLCLCSGNLLDERMERLFQSFDGYIERRLQGNALTDAQKLVLAYLIKSEWANELLRYTILLTPDNDYLGSLLELERRGLIVKHEKSTPLYPIYVADRVLLSKDYLTELRALFGMGFDSLDRFLKDILGIVYRHNTYSKTRAVSAKLASFALWYEGDRATDEIKQFDVFYRKVRYSFNKLLKSGFIVRDPNAKGYVLNRSYVSGRLF